MREQKSNVPGKSVRTVAEELEITRQTSGQHICTPCSLYLPVLSSTLIPWRPF